MLHKDAALRDGAAPSAFRFLGFSAGSHACIGQKLAVQEAVVLLARLCTRFHIGASLCVLSPDHLFLLSY
jgi:cytochrome P450